MLKLKASFRSALKLGLTAATGSSALSGWVIFATGMLLAGCALWFQFPSLALFVWHCFLAPLGDPKDQKSRLDKVRIPCVNSVQV